MNIEHEYRVGNKKRCSLFRGLIGLTAISLFISGTGFADTNLLDPNNSFFFATTAYRATGLESVYFNLVDNQDVTPPIVAVITPSAESLSSDKVPISINSSQNIALSRVQFLVNGEPIAEAVAAPFLVSWDTSTLARGEYVISVLAYDDAGHRAASEDLSVTIAGDTIAPTVALAAPGGAGTASGKITVSASASDNVKVAKTEIYLDETLVSSDLQGSVSYTWDTLTAANGSHVLSAKAYDSAGNVGISSPLALTVFNDTTAPLVAIGALPVGGSLGGTVAVTASASDNVAVARVEFYLNGVLQATSTGAPYAFKLNTVAIANGTYALSAKAYDAAGNVGQSAPVALTVFNDRVAPLLSINAVSSPVAVTSLTISGQVSDNDAVAKVTVQVGSGAAAAAAFSGAGWSFPLKNLASGSNLITVRATDRSGNSSTATASIIVQLPYTIQDAQLAMQIAAGLIVPTSAQLQRLDIAPIVNGKSSPNGKIDTADVVAILAKIKQ
jgi:chitinase